MDTLEHQLRYLEKNSCSQTKYLEQLTAVRGWLLTRGQEEVIETVIELRRAGERDGDQNKKFYSLPKFRLPRLRLPHLDGPTWVVLLMALAVLLLLCWRLDGIWSSLSRPLK